MSKITLPIIYPKTFNSKTRLPVEYDLKDVEVEQIPFIDNKDGKIKVSIIIPVWNQEDLIIKCLDSIPDRNDIEVIVVNDGSTDRTEESVLNYTRLKNLRYLKQENSGPGIARDKGFEAAKGEFVYSTDSDDYLITDNWLNVLDSELLHKYDVIRGYSVFPGGHIGGPGCILTNAFMKRDLAVQIKNTNKMAGEDCQYGYKFYDKFRPLGLKEITVKIAFFFYNYPREGSLYWLATHKH